jgi:hypothetical protein
MSVRSQSGIANLLGVRKTQLGLLTGLAALLLLPGPALAAAGAPPAPAFAKPYRLPGSAGWSEPRTAVGPGNWRYVISNMNGAPDTVFYSTDSGHTWHPSKGTPTGQSSPSSDVDITVAPTGRVIATELDFGGAAGTQSGAINFRTSYSDDHGATWTASTGMVPVDTDRPYVEAGGIDPVTGKPDVYVLLHNLASGVANHNMYVQTSRDGGATFGPAVPTTMPGDQAYSDLQCADSGGPSNIKVAADGTVYVAFGTRTSVVPVQSGCFAQPVGANVIPATRIWVAWSKTPDVPGSWHQSLAVNDSGTAPNGAGSRIVGQEVSPLAIDRHGDVYVAFAEGQPLHCTDTVSPLSCQPPDYAGALKYTWAAPSQLAAGHWNGPYTVAPYAETAGHALPHVVAGQPGRLMFTYITGIPQPSGDPLWYSTVAETVNGTATAPAFTQEFLSADPVIRGTNNALMADCGSGPAAGIVNGLACNRSPDLYGIALDSRCLATVVWPDVAGDVNGNPIPGDVPGTRVSTQVGGAALC